MKPKALFLKELDKYNKEKGEKAMKQAGWTVNLCSYYVTWFSTKNSKKDSCMAKITETLAEPFKWCYFIFLVGSLICNFCDKSWLI